MQKRSLLLFLFIISYFLAVAQIDTSTQRFNLECIEGDTLLNDPYCHFCPPGQLVEFWGIKVTSPNNRLKYIRHDYLVEIRGKDIIWITYDVDSSFAVDWRITNFYQDNINTAVDSLRSCPQPPEDTIGAGCLECAMIDTFRIVDGYLEISLTTEDSVWRVDLREACNLCDGQIVTVYREYFDEVSTDSIIVSVNDGNIPDSSDQFVVYVEGIRQREGPPGQGDYTIQDSIVHFNYTLDSEDAWVWFFDQTGGVAVDRSYHSLVTGTTVPISVIPDSSAQIMVFVEGIKQSEGVAGQGDYTISGGHINFNYSLSNEDVETWVLSNLSPGILVYDELTSSVTGTVVTITDNGGVLPVLDQAVKVYVEGLNQQDGNAGDYTLTNVGEITFKYNLENEDVNTWFWLGTADVGFLGLFQN